MSLPTAENTLPSTTSVPSWIVSPETVMIVPAFTATTSPTRVAHGALGDAGLVATIDAATPSASAPGTKSSMGFISVLLGLVVRLLSVILIARDFLGLRVKQHFGIFVVVRVRVLV